jgi:hypothetical protein
MILFSTLVWYLIARRFLVLIVKRALVRGIRPLATGFIAFLATPVVSIILIMSVLGSFVGVVGLVAYAFAILLALVSGTAVVGQFIMTHVKKSEQALSPVTLSVGVLATLVAAFIPFIGPTLLLMVFLVTMGAIVDLLLHPDA